MSHPTFRAPKAACIAVALALGCAISARAQSTPVFPISSVIEQVKREISAAQTTAGASLRLDLEKVEATLIVSRTVDANGKVSVGVPSIPIEVGAGGSRRAEESSSVYVELVPPKPTGLLSKVDARDFGLTDAIVQARSELLKGLDEEPRLEPRKVVITVKFGITKTVGGDAKLKLVVISVGGGTSVAAADTNTIVLTFAKRRGV